MQKIIKAVIPFKAEHIKAFNNDPNADWDLIGRQYEKHAEAYTATIDGEIMFCGGITILWKGVGEAWVFVEEETANKYPVFLYKTVKTQMNKIIKSKQLVRVGTNIYTNFEKGRSWITHLGFEYEGLQRKFGVGGIDAWRYARVM